MTDAGSKGRVFISYKKNVGKSHGLFGREVISFLPVVKSIAELLKDHGYSVFYDQHIGVSTEWFGQIAKELLSSELVLLLLSKGTLQSHWVQSEVHFAKELGISIFPLGCGLDNQQVSIELRTAGLSHIQGAGTMNYRPGQGTELWAEIGDHLSSAIQTARTEQSKRLTDLLRVRQARRVAQPNQSLIQFTQPTRGGDSVAIHIATGDIANFRGIDVIASSENDRMQMARLIDGKTVSGMLREQGVCQAPRYDALQRELDIVVDDYARKNGAPVPIAIGEVLVTSSGHPNGPLRRWLGCRYILHVSSTMVLLDGQLQTLSNESQLRACVRNCLEALNALKEANGIISPPQTPQREQQEAAASQPTRLDSILLPLFGVGRGGMNIKDVARVMAQELKEILSSAEAGAYGGIRNVHVAIFYEDDIELVRAIFTQVFGREVASS